jgi:hypothetical protein
LWRGHRIRVLVGNQAWEKEVAEPKCGCMRRRAEEWGREIKAKKRKDKSAKKKPSFLI